MQAPRVRGATVGFAGAVGLAAVGIVWLGLGERSRDEAALQFAHYPEFQLEDPTGRLVTPADFRGRFLLVLFGFTECPDVCPTTLSKVGDVMDTLGEDADRVQPLFISVDPEHDTRADLARYTATFHPAILGLTGSPGTVRVAAENFHVFYDQPFDATEAEGFDVGHSSSLLLLSPDGAWLRAFDEDTPAAAISTDLMSRLD